MSRRSTTRTKRQVRCAIYTRKSTEEGLEQEFNSLDAQREAAEAYIASQRHEGWQALPRTYDDGGFTGGNLDRPGLQQLLEDIQAGQIGCVVVYKVDRLSRSLLDFARLMAIFEENEVSFVSVTQQFNTASSMGRLMLNVLLSFAQFEREIIAERTRDKMGAARRKGKWLGSRPMLGYDADRERQRLVVNEKEAARVRAIFRLYLELGTTRRTVEELARRGWSAKQVTTRKGTTLGGAPFTKAALHYLLTNVVYLGQVRYKDQVFPGEQEAIVSEELFNEVRERLQENRRSDGRRNPSRFRGLLDGILHCTTCDAAIWPAHTTRNRRRYRYYVCGHARQHGYDQCPTGQIPATEIEQLVTEELRPYLSELLPEGPFESAWMSLSTQRQGQLIQRLVRQIDYDGERGEMKIQLSSDRESTRRNGNGSRRK